ncbi:MAG: type II toxin-antitoxin system VapC family toxin [Candidatus Thermoplasmatota archaeon]|nr:type II toxin-antitoxin system VapC family toxin [Candidatus Thermoplasmatota archaeon]MCL5785293.1 type II toxin-antitoxin system VapC family toxin [Candidatus Thermoplasmatota archaeon]
MKVADTSYVVGGLLRDQTIFESEDFLVPELALYEIVNVIWKHEMLIRDIRRGLDYIEALDELIDAGVITVITYGDKISRAAYGISLRRKIAVYDSIFIALALETSLDLVTLDKEQRKAFEGEIKVKR